ncbi:MAG: Ig-like domain-containing protein, partial [bacterium]|nr:Ig-like domain-containing protein [bacterium]
MKHQSVGTCSYIIREISKIVAIFFIIGGSFFSVSDVLAEVTITQTTNGSQISADTNSTNGSGVYTALTGPIIAEGVLGDIGKDTIILNSPTGFAFDIGTQVTASVTNGSCVGAGNKVLKLGTGSGSSSQTVTPTSSTITINVKQNSASNTGNSACLGTLTFNSVRVFPTLAGSTLSSGNITKTGTSTIQGITDGTTSLGALTEITGAISASRSILEANPTTITADGVATSTILVTVRDQFDNLISGASLLFTASGTANTISQPTSPSNVSGQTQGSITSTRTGTKTISAEADGVLITQTASVVFTPGEAANIIIVTQPGGGGSVDNALTIQPVIRVTDKEDNSVTDGTVVSASLLSGIGVLRNTTSTTLAGDASFTNLGYSKSGESFTILFTSGLVSGGSESIAALSAGAITSTQLTPSTTTITVGDTVPYSVTGADQFGNSLGDVTGQTVFATSSESIGSFGIGEAGAIYTSLKAGVVIITATTSSVIASTSLTVLPLSLPSALPIPGAYTTSQNIILNTDANYDIRYTIDGSD